MHLIISKDREDIRRTLSSLLRDQSEPASLFYPENFTVEAFSQEVETLPFLSKAKRVIVHEIDQLSKEQLGVIQQYIEKPSKWISLYLTATQLAPQSKLVKLVEKSGKVIRFKEEKPWDKEKRLANWLIEEAQVNGVQFSPQAATALVKAVDHQMLKCELEKLICFVGTRQEITLEDISLMCTPIHHETLWQLGDALFAREIANALKVGRILLDEGMAIFPLLANLRSQFNTGIGILKAAQDGVVSQKFPYLKGRLLDKKLGVLKKYGEDLLRRGLIVIFEAEIQAKNSAEPYLLLELLIARLTYDTLPTSQCAGIC